MNFSSRVFCATDVSGFSFVRQVVRKAVSGGGVEGKTESGFSFNTDQSAD